MMGQHAGRELDPNERGGRACQLYVIIAGLMLHAP